MTNKDSYRGIRDLKDISHIEEEDILSSDGTLVGIKNRVRAGMEMFQNTKALEWRHTEENKIVIYTTSFRGVRSTFEDCKYVLSIFHNHRVRIEERDIYIHQDFHRELEERLRNEKMSVPQVFISGQHIGGKAEVDELNELGELKKLLEDFPKIEAVKNCTICGGYEFVPCMKCGGSKNSVANNFTFEFRALKCTSCNENGLQPCPQCNVCNDI